MQESSGFASGRDWDTLSEEWNDEDPEHKDSYANSSFSAGGGLVGADQEEEHGNGRQPFENSSFSGSSRQGTFHLQGGSSTSQGGRPPLPWQTGQLKDIFSRLTLESMFVPRGTDEEGGEGRRSERNDTRNISVSSARTRPQLNYQADMSFGERPSSESYALSDNPGPQSLVTTPTRTRPVSDNIPSVHRTKVPGLLFREEQNDNEMDLNEVSRDFFSGDIRGSPLQEFQEELVSTREDGYGFEVGVELSLVHCTPTLTFCLPLVCDSHPRLTCAQIHAPLHQYHEQLQTIAL